MNEPAGGGQGPDTPTRSSDNGTNKSYSTAGSVQAPSDALDPWEMILAGEAGPDDVERVLALLDGLERGKP